MSGLDDRQDGLGVATRVEDICELLVKNYVPAVVRGFTPIQFNLINEIKTDVYNPFAIAAEAAREGDFTQCALYIENVAEVFFPLDGGEDPVWPNAANNAFKRAAYGLIDFYMEEERRMREADERAKIAPEVTEVKVDRMWAKVTPYNCYQLFVQLTSRKQKNPMTRATEMKKAAAAIKNGKSAQEVGLSADDEALIQDGDRFAKFLDNAMFESSKLFDKAPDADELALYFSATEQLPRNGIRTLVMNAHNSLRSMGAAEKMLSSVYGISVTALSFFADPRIATLTSGSLSQNTDLGGLSFPRRIGVRLHADYMDRAHLVGLIGRWQAFADPEFKESLGKDFYHEALLRRDGWSRYAIKGIFPKDVAYIRLELVNSATSMLVKTFYFEFKKDYQKSLDGRTYVIDPVLNTKIVKNGVLREMFRFKNGTFTFAHRRFKSEEVVLDTGRTRMIQRRAVQATSVHYSEKPKIVFLVTPPHLTKYAKLILILVKQLVDVSFDASYMTRTNQAPDIKTNFMLDELGNLQSEGHGIASFQTMLSIGLGQGQQFTLILQTLQQLRDVYGDSVDKIIQGNAQPLIAKIATPDGWETMGDMRVGSKVLTPKGTVATVLGVYPKGTRPVYRVTMKDGSTTFACNEHLWAVRTAIA